MELWELIYHYTLLGCKISFDRMGYNQNMITMEKNGISISSILPDDHLPGSLTECIAFMYNTKLKSL